jgi:hypothetical protein
MIVFQLGTLLFFTNEAAKTSPTRRCWKAIDVLDLFWELFSFPPKKGAGFHFKSTLFPRGGREDLSFFIGCWFP